MTMLESHEYLNCPFCENRCIKPESGKSMCPECGSEFVIDDRLECFFADTEKLRLPAKGMVCSLCGLIQNDDVQTCLYCGMQINSTVQ